MGVNMKLVSELRITGSVLLIIFKSLIPLCFITCLIRISLNLKNDQKNRPHDPVGQSDCLNLCEDFVKYRKKNNENIDIFAEKLGENLKKVYICTKENLKKV